MRGRYFLLLVTGELTVIQKVSPPMLISPISTAKLSASKRKTLKIRERLTEKMKAFRDVGDRRGQWG